MKTSTFGYTNTSTSTRSYDDYQIGIITNYGLKEDEPTRVILDNRDAPIDQAELITYQGQRLKNVSNGCNNNYPPVPGDIPGISYVVKVEELLSTVDSETGMRVDEPITMYITVKHPISGNFTSTQITEVFNRLKGALMNDDGTYKWSDLMRHCFKPTAN